MNQLKISDFTIIIFTLIASIFALKTISLLNTKIKNEAIDGCAQDSFYQIELLIPKVVTSPIVNLKKLFISNVYSTKIFLFKNKFLSEKT